MFNVLVCVFVILALPMMSIFCFLLTSFLPILIYYLCPMPRIYVDVIDKHLNIEHNLRKLKLRQQKITPAKFNFLVFVLIILGLSATSNLRFPLYYSFIS